ncbi:MAG TPA: MazG nucleotide pyrophosphohydrolase domain-containing protein, partial [Chitinophagaceae bacterium]|nr:MazG nucleotide pyrophosphohydrolase domain-containing protein [Chitinophagaceae bacterium]
WEKVEEEIVELKSAIGNWQSASDEELTNCHKKVEEEFGDVIFSLINYARFLRVDAENALEVTNKKFTRRFIQMEEEATRNGKTLAEMTLIEMDSIWNTIKKRT